MTHPFAFDCRFSYATGFELDVAFDATSETGQPYQTLAISGPSGSGKTTILSLVAGLLTPRDGTIRVNGRTLFCSRNETDLPPWKRRVGFLFQHDALFPHLTVERNLLFGIQAAAKQAPVWEFGETIELLQLEPFLKRRPPSLSGGQKQRVALGRTLLSCPEILLLDEPLGAVESDLRDTILTSTKARASQHCVPIILVSHDGHVLEQMADQVLHISRGKVVSALN